MATKRVWQTTQQFLIIGIHDANTNHDWRFEVDVLKPEVTVFKNCVEWRKFHHVEHPVTAEFLMGLTKQ